MLTDTHYFDMATCLCCSLRIGILIYSSLLVLAYIIKLGIIAYLLFFQKGNVGPSQSGRRDFVFVIFYPLLSETYEGNLQKSIYLVQFTITIASLLNGGLLLLGAASKNENILRPWMCFSFVILLTIFCSAIFQLYEADILSFSISTTELLTNGVGYSCVFCNLEELSNILSDDEGEDYVE